MYVCMYKLLKLKLAASDGPKNTSPLPPPGRNSHPPPQKKDRKIIG